MNVVQWGRHMQKTRPRVWWAIRYPVVLGTYALYLLSFAMQKVGKAGDGLYRFIGIWWL